MNTVVTSREQILDAAKEIAALEGATQISIRGVAKACGVSVGSIYNYFPTKSELVIAVIEDFWRGAFSGMPTAAGTSSCSSCGRPLSRAWSAWHSTAGKQPS